MMKSIFSSIVSILSIGTILSGCVAEEYNLDKLNKEVSINWESLSAPIKDKEIIKVSDIFNFENNSNVITTDEGYYHIYISNQVNTTSFFIKDFSYESRMKETYVSEIPAKECDVEVEMEHGFTLSSNSIPSEVKSIERIDIDCTVIPTFAFTKTDSVRRIIMKKGSQLILPKWMVVGEYDSSLLTVKNNVVTIIKDLDVTSEGISSILKISALDFTNTNKKSITVSNDTINLEDSFVTVGHLAILKEDIVKPIEESHFDVSFRCDISEADIQSVKAVIKPTIRMDFDDVNMKDFTSLFPIENTVNLYDVGLNLEIDNNTPLSAHFSADLESIVEGSVMTSAHIGPVPTMQNEKTSVAISQRQRNRVDNLTSIINSRPEVISVKNVTFEASDEAALIETGKTYYLSTNYAIDAPIAFCDDLNYKFDHDMSIGIKLNDATIESLVINLNAENTIPVGLKMTGEVLDNNGEVIPNATIKFDNDIKPGTLQNKSTAPLKITIIPAGNIDNIKTLKIHFTGFNDEDTAGECLNESQKLSFVDISATINGMQLQLNKK